MISIAAAAERLEKAGGYDLIMLDLATPARPQRVMRWNKGNCSRRMVSRGGWESGAATLRTSVRHVVDADGKFYFLGFRLAERG